VRIRIVASAALAAMAWGCASVRDTMEGRESGTSRVVAASVDQTWTAVVAVMQPYPIAEMDMARGKVVTAWVERLVELEAYAQYGVLKERARFEIAIAAGDGGGLVTVRHTAELFSPVFSDPVAPDQRPFCQFLCVNPWETPRGSPVYAWRHSSQVKDAPASISSQKEQEILDAIEAAVRGISEQRSASGAPPTNATN